MFVYTTRGVCSKSIELDVESGIVTYCKINGGCRGNTQGLAKMVIGRKVEDVISSLKGIQCQGSTSCPDQLACALEQYLLQTSGEK
ncbi:MAG: TIGR03905 family TSCPD domain-containing protein [Kiritimatiellae bacterium]|nr:TIGR03905 family TSCPD domain-containing protein [Kiritimatiellia bacterium]